MYMHQNLNFGLRIYLAGEFSVALRVFNILSEISLIIHILPPFRDDDISKRLKELEKMLNLSLSGQKEIQEKFDKGTDEKVEKARKENEEENRKLRKELRQVCVNSLMPSDAYMRQ